MADPYRCKLTWQAATRCMQTAWLATFQHNDQASGTQAYAYAWEPHACTSVHAYMHAELKSYRK